MLSLNHSRSTPHLSEILGRVDNSIVEPIPRIFPASPGGHLVTFPTVFISSHVISVPKCKTRPRFCGIKRMRTVLQEPIS
jgi:hypothetical protein